MIDDKVVFSNGDLEAIRRRLLNWWAENKRHFPWRSTDNPFHILLSEVLLQRTKADQVTPVYVDLVSRYPRPTDFIGLERETLAKILYSLGLPKRIDTIIKMVQQINREFRGKVPDEYGHLRQLEGVGDYIASAVCCFGFNHPRIVVDTNTVRIIGRVFGITTHAESRRKRDIREKHAILLDMQHPKAYNYALLDLGALICTPRNPQCESCPLNAYCEYGKSKLGN